MQLAVTTSIGASADAVAAAREAAVRWSLPFVARREQALSRVAKGAGVPLLLVLSERAAALWTDGRVARWTAGMGALRVERLRAGEVVTRDGFLEAARLREGDHVFDATLGLGADALVAAEAVGPAGRVTALEASLPLAALTAEGLRRLADPAAARIDVVHGEAAAWLARAADATFDVVVFDPMFGDPLAEPPGFDIVRRLCDPRPLERETLLQARRVARRSVVVKDGAPGRDLARLGLTPLPRARGAQRVYARLEPSGDR